MREIRTLRLKWRDLETEQGETVERTNDRKNNWLGNGLVRLARQFSTLPVVGPAQKWVGLPDLPSGRKITAS